MDIKINLSSFNSSEILLEENHIYDVLIIGGGPAAMNALLYTARKRLDVGMITKEIGGQITQSASIENWLGIANIKSIDLVNHFFEHIQEFKKPVQKNITVTSMNLNNQIKEILCSNGQKFQAKTIIIATGKSPHKLGISGEEQFIGKGVAYCTTCDGPIFKDKKVVIVGGGNSGVEAAIDMLSYAKEIVIVQNLSTLTADAILVEKVLHNPRITTIYDSVCVRIEGSQAVENLIINNTKTNQEQTISTDGIFVEIGLIPASGFVPDILKTSHNEIEIDTHCKTKISGVFAAGDVTTVPFKQVIIAAGEGAKAALAAYNYIISN